MTSDTTRATKPPLAKPTGEQVPRSRLSTRIHRRRRKRGEEPTGAAACRNFCLECSGYNDAEIERCSIWQCWLYPWRFGVKPETAAKEGKNVW
jgi:hypothetical protein